MPDPDAGFDPVNDPGDTRTLIGGIGELYQGDLDAGRVFVNQLAELEQPAGVVVEDLSYGAIAVVQRLQDLRPQSLVLIGAVRRGRPPGTIERREHEPEPRPPADVQLAVGDAITGYIGVDLLLAVAGGMGWLPPRTIVYEIEPEIVEPSDEISESVHEALGRLHPQVQADALLLTIEA